MSKAGELIKQLAGSVEATLHVCKVISVDGATCNVEPIDGSAELHGVRLNAVTSNSAGIIITPIVESVVIVNQISKVDSYVSLFSEIEKIEIGIGTFKIVLNENEMVFNEGSLGLPKIDKLVERINRLEDKLKLHQHMYINAVGVTTPTTEIPGDPVLTFLNTERVELEDTKIKH